MMENYQETEWSAMTELEDDLQKLEGFLAGEFGEAASDNGK